MTTVAEAINTLISAVNVAHNKGGVYNLEESHYIYMAISYLNSIQQENPQEAAPEASQQAQQAQQTPTQEAAPEAHQVVEEVKDNQDQQKY